jgi:hypothetical protein
LATAMLRPQDFDQFPYFSFHAESLPEGLSRVAVPLEALIVFASIVSGCGLARILRYPIVG